MTGNTPSTRPTPRTVLCEAGVTIGQLDWWCQGAMAMDKNGNATLPGSTDRCPLTGDVIRQVPGEFPVRFSILGAVWRVTEDQYLRDRAKAWLRKAAGMNPERYNDLSTTTHADALAVIARAVILATEAGE